MKNGWYSWISNGQEWYVVLPHDANENKDNDKCNDLRCLRQQWQLLLTIIIMIVIYIMTAIIMMLMENVWWYLTIWKMINHLNNDNEYNKKDGITNE